MGVDKAVKYWKEYGGFEMLLVTDENKIYLTEEIQDAFFMNDTFLDMEVHVIKKL